MEISGWGRFPKIDAEISFPVDKQAWKSALGTNQSLIARGLGRSYGDSANARIVLQIITFILIPKKVFCNVRLG